MHLHQWQALAAADPAGSVGAWRQWLGLAAVVGLAAAAGPSALSGLS